VYPIVMLSSRRLVPELMDDPGADPAALSEALRFIRFVNRRLGGTNAALRYLKRWIRGRGPDEVIRLLDIGTGSADIPRAIADWAISAGRRVRITAVDLHPTTLALAREHLGPRDDIELVEADARSLMDRYAPGDFDYVHAGMFLHHLPDIEVLTVLRIMDRLASRGLIWNDLIRGRLEMIGVRLLAATAPAMARHDAITSVNAGFTPRQALDYARRVGWERPSCRRHLFGRFTVTSLKK